MVRIFIRCHGLSFWDHVCDSPSVDVHEVARCMRCGGRGIPLGGGAGLETWREELFGGGTLDSLCLGSFLSSGLPMTVQLLTFPVQGVFLIGCLVGLFVEGNPCLFRYHRSGNVLDQL